MWGLGAFQYINATGNQKPASNIFANSKTLKTFSLNPPGLIFLFIFPSSEDYDK
jgi:hypothetical protein